MMVPCFLSPDLVIEMLLLGHWINCVGALRYGDIFATGQLLRFLVCVVH